MARQGEGKGTRYPPPQRPKLAAQKFPRGKQVAQQDRWEGKKDLKAARAWSEKCRCEGAGKWKGAAGDCGLGGDTRGSMVTWGGVGVWGGGGGGGNLPPTIRKPCLKGGRPRGRCAWKGERKSGAGGPLVRRGKQEAKGGLLRRVNRWGDKRGKKKRLCKEKKKKKTKEGRRIGKPIGAFELEKKGKDEKSHRWIGTWF